MHNNYRAIVTNAIHGYSILLNMKIIVEMLTPSLVLWQAVMNRSIRDL